MPLSHGVAVDVEDFKGGAEGQEAQVKAVGKEVVGEVEGGEFGGQGADGTESVGFQEESGEVGGAAEDVDVVDVVVGEVEAGEGGWEGLGWDGSGEVVEGQVDVDEAGQDLGVEVEGLGKEGRVRWSGGKRGKDEARKD